MRTAAIAASFFLLTVVLATWTWAAARNLRLPGAARAVLGLTLTPLVLPVITLALTLAWPGAPAEVIVTAPGILVFAVVLWRRVEFLRTWAVLGKRLARQADGRVVGIVSGFVLLFAIGWMLVVNASEPVTAHDALIYLNEARIFAGNPRWETWTEMTAPTAPEGLVRGHTHTWYYPAFLATFQAAQGEFGGQPAWDWPARAFGQLNVLALVLAVGALAWTVTRGGMALTVAAMVGLVCLPHFGYISTANSIDAFRLLPLVLAALVLTPAQLSRGGWALAAGLVAAAAAAHSLNVIFGPLLLAARIFTGLGAGQWSRIFTGAVPVLLGGLLLIAGYYVYVWHETGRFFGHGMNYYFYLGPLAEAQGATYLLRPAPAFGAAIWELAQTHSAAGVWTPLACALLAVLVSSPPSLRFLGLVFLLALGVAMGGDLLDPLHKLTLMMLQNFRYPLGILVFGPPLMAGVLAWAARRKDWIGRTRGLKHRQLAAAVVMLGVAGTGAWQVSRHWRREFDVQEYLRVGEGEIAGLVARHVEEGAIWLTDRNTVAYYAPRAPVFLYTPAGVKWIQLSTEEEAIRALRDERVRLVALYNAEPDWWPRTPLYQALSRPGVAERIRLPRWEVFVVGTAAGAKERRAEE